MTNKHFIREDGKMLGPFSAERIKSMIEDGKLASGAEYSTDRRHWIPVSKFSCGEKAALKPEIMEPEIRLEKVPRMEKTELPGISLNRADSSDSRCTGARSTQNLSGEATVHPSSGMPQPFFHLLWNPPECLPDIYTRRGDQSSMLAGLAVSACCVGLIVYASSQTPDSAMVPAEKLAALLAIPVLSLVIVLFAIRSWFGTGGKGGVGGDCLIAGTAILMPSVSTLAASLISKHAGLSPEQLACVLMAFLIYSTVHSFISVHSGLKNISGVPDSVLTTAMSTLILATALITYWLFIKFLNSYG